jgi:DNA-binding transcriptional MerR regulator
MAERTHLSIGEVLSLLREEFPDVTISKIRFLESQGLVDPERTPSGYRKFYDHDVERLRWILRQQRENFLPLKIIRGRLTEHGTELEEGEPIGDHDGDSAARPPAQSATEPPEQSREEAIETSAAAHPAAATRHREAVTTPASVVEGTRPASASRADSSIRSREAPGSTSGGNSGERLQADPGPASGWPGPSADRPRTRGDAPGLGDEIESFSAEELAEACGGTVAMVTDLQQYGLITPRAVVGGTAYFDASALDVAKAAAGFSRHGVEARHLRAWRNAADREAGIFEQVIVPLLRQRNPEARRQAAATLAELAAFGADLRQALVDQALRQIR